MKPYEKETALKLAKITRAGRKLAGLTQLELAKGLDVTQGYISKLEKGLLIPSATHWFRFCETMSIPAYSGQTGFIDQCLKISLSDESQIGLFKIPDIYSFSRGTAVRMSRPLLSYFEQQFGAKRTHEFLLSKGLDPDYFTIFHCSLNMNFNLDLARELIRAGKLSEESIPQIAGCMSESHGDLLREYKEPQSPVTLVQALEKNVERYDVNWDYSFDYSRKDRIEIEATPKLHMRKFKCVDEILGNFLALYHGQFFRQFLVDSQVSFNALKTICSGLQGQDKCAYHISLA